MSASVDLNKVLDVLINEGEEQADALVKQWMLDKARFIVSEQLQEDDSVLEGGDQTQDIENDQDAIESEEFYGEGDDEQGEEPVEVADDDAALDGGIEADQPVELEDKVDDLKSELARLKSQFNALLGVEEPEHDMDFNDDGEIGEPAAEGGEGETEEGDVEESIQVDEDFVDLDESFRLEPVADPNLSGAKEIGADGAAVHLNDKSPIPQKKGEARVGGKAVEINAEEHKGYAREAAPEVAKAPLLKNQVKNAKSDLEGVSKEGDKSAMLNKNDGFGKDSPKSPIGAGATDLRGSDLKRK